MQTLRITGAGLRDRFGFPHPPGQLLCLQFLSWTSDQAFTTAGHPGTSLSNHRPSSRSIASLCDLTPVACLLWALFSYWE